MNQQSIEFHTSVRITMLDCMVLLAIFFFLISGFSTVLFYESRNSGQKFTGVQAQSLKNDCGDNKQYCQQPHTTNVDKRRTRTNTVKLDKRHLKTESGKSQKISENDHHDFIDKRDQARLAGLFLLALRKGTNKQSN